MIENKFIANEAKSKHIQPCCVIICFSLFVYLFVYFSFFWLFYENKMVKKEIMIVIGIYEAFRAKMFQNFWFKGEKCRDVRHGLYHSPISLHRHQTYEFFSFFLLVFRFTFLPWACHMWKFYCTTKPMSIKKIYIVNPHTTLHLFHIQHNVEL